MENMGLDSKCFEIDHRLKELYEKWLVDINNNAPLFLDEKYSNPYYSCVPKGWFHSSKRILIVGEEGFGLWGRGKEDGVMPNEIALGQSFCWSSLASYLGYDLEYDLYPEAKRFNNRNSPFWRRARRLSEYGVCSWTNIDLFHHRSIIKGMCALSALERQLLHSVTTKVLEEQIRILDPTYVVYAGWYGVSLQHELPDVFELLYPNGLGDSSIWKKNVVTIVDKSGIKHVFAYHPSWGIRQKGYEDKVIKAVSE